MENGVACEAVLGTLKNSERTRILDEYENGNINILCACDLLMRAGTARRRKYFFGQAHYV